MNPTLHVEMEEILFGLETDEETKVIVLTGAGNATGALGWISSSIFARRMKFQWRASGRQRRIVAGQRSCSRGRASQASPWLMVIVTAAH